MSIEVYFLNKGALIIGIADKRPLIQRALFWPVLLSSAIGDSTAAPPGIENCPFFLDLSTHIEI